jgi:hypothetical protein
MFVHFFVECVMNFVDCRLPVGVSTAATVPPTAPSVAGAGNVFVCQPRCIVCEVVLWVRVWEERPGYPLSDDLRVRNLNKFRFLGYKRA